MKNVAKWTAAIIGLLICVVLVIGALGAVIDGEAISKVASERQEMTTLFCLLLGISMGTSALHIVGWMLSDILERRDRRLA